MNDLNKIKAVYFIGAGGIGMSALVRYFIHLNKFVAGYDKTPTDLTDHLIHEGADIHFTDNVEAIPAEFRSVSDTLVVYTPAIPSTHKELNYFKENGFRLMKRAEVLGLITKNSKGLCVAGTHGKTTTSTMIAHLLHSSSVGCNAFLGGISKNYDTNLLLSDKSPYSVIEADEFDRSFHWLTPYISVITATDPDHLDIYGTAEAYMESFEHYTTLIQEGGALVMRKGIALVPQLKEGVRLFTYGLGDGDFHAENIRIGNGEIRFDFVAPDGRISDVELGVPVTINIENGVAAMAVARLSGVTDEELREGMRSFRGVNRRFDFKYRNERGAFLSDYGHHPTEVMQSIKSLRQLYADRKITVIFQPHLYTRTRDFYKDFAKSLSLADEVILTDIYPAREQPIEGVTSRLIYDCLAEGVEKYLCRKEEVTALLSEGGREVVMVLGAGDLDNYCPQIEKVLKEKMGR